MASETIGARVTAISEAQDSHSLVVTQSQGPEQSRERKGGRSGSFSCGKIQSKVGFVRCFEVGKKEDLISLRAV